MHIYLYLLGCSHSCLNCAFNLLLTAPQAWPHTCSVDKNPDSVENSAGIILVAVVYTRVQAADVNVTD